ncbi:hypothetical protein [Nostoc flagelliforme]|uniref:hypothetical protein n=1 Tax=Nostoc flagelliforme TaxID=1306274 RepID=UPI001F5506CB|nr:hypothetical protein [Nostoc flagelliforme]
MTITFKHTKRNNNNISLSEVLENPQIEKIVPLIVPVLVLVLWELSSRTGLLSTRILPATSGIIATAIELASTGELFQHVGISAGRGISGFIVGGSIGFDLGLLNGFSRIAEKLLDGSLQMLRTIPNLALILLIILLFGIGDQARLFLVSMSVFFSIYLNTFHGIRSVAPIVKLILLDHLIADIEPHLPSNIDVVEVDSEGNLDGDASDAEVYVNGFYLKTSTTGKSFMVVTERLYHTPLFRLVATAERAHSTTLYRQS